MSDVFDREKRSQVMRAVKSKNTKTTELTMINLFREHHINGWRRTYPVKGHPDFVFLKKKVAVFVDGCFWHGHDGRNTRPANKADYWRKKREHNIQHDMEITAAFEKRGWTVLRIWECELKKKNQEKTLERIMNVLHD